MKTFKRRFENCTFFVLSQHEVEVHCSVSYREPKFQKKNELKKEQQPWTNYISRRRTGMKRRLLVAEHEQISQAEVSGELIIDQVQNVQKEI